MASSQFATAATRIQSPGCYTVRGILERCESAVAWIAVNSETLSEQRIRIRGKHICKNIQIGDAWTLYAATTGTGLADTLDFTSERPVETRRNRRFSEPAIQWKAEKCP